MLSAIAPLVVIGLVNGISVYYLRKRRRSRGSVTPARQPNFVAPRYVFGVLLGGPFLVSFFVTGSWLAFVIAAPFLVAASSVWLNTFVFVPLGLVRTAWAVDRFSGGVGRLVERRAGSALPAARALLRRPDEAGARFIEDYLATCLQLGTAGAAATALVALSRGQRDDARAVFAVLEDMGRSEALPAAARMAREYLVLDAVARSDWARVDVLGDRPAASRLVRLWARIARRVLGRADAPSERAVWRAWVLAAGRRPTKLAVASALRIAARPGPAPVAPSLDAHVALFRCDPSRLRDHDVASAALSLDALRSTGAFQASLERRALTLGAPGAGAAASEAVLRDAEEDIAQLLLEARAPANWLPPGPTGDTARERLREARLVRAAALATELQRRARELKDLPEAEEWRAWGDARQACREALLDADSAPAYDALFRNVYRPFNAYAARLINVRSRRVLGGDVVRFLLSLARLAEARDTYDLLEGNTSAVRGDRMPRVERLEGELVGRPGISARPVVVVWALIAAVLAVGIVVAASIAVGFDPGLPLFFVTMLGISVVLAIGVARDRMVECSLTADGLNMQNRFGFFIAPADEVTLRRGPGRIVRIHLRRAPAWMPRHTFTVSPAKPTAEPSGLMPKR